MGAYVRSLTGAFGAVGQKRRMEERWNTDTAFEEEMLAATKWCVVAPASVAPT